jgi:hypothetical protein
LGRAADGDVESNYDCSGCTNHAEVTGTDASLFRKAPIHGVVAAFHFWMRSKPANSRKTSGKSRFHLEEIV